MEDFQSNVKCLAALAFDSIYQNIISKLKNSLDRSSPPPSKKRKVIISSTPAIVASIRAQLDEYLISSYSQVRWNLIQKLMKSNFTNPIKVQIIQDLVLSFLDSVLDNSFSSLDLCGLRSDKALAATVFTTQKTPIPLTEPAILLAIIAHHSPLLKNLNLAFTMPSQTAPLGPSFCLQLGKFVNLTKLNLSFKTSNSCIDLFICLGQALHQLASLQLAKIPFGTDQLLALILGSKHALLPPNFSTPEEKLMDLQFSPECVSPICSSLMQLIIECDHTSCQHKVPLADLVYRHLRKMKNYGCSIDCKHPSPLVNPFSSVIQQLHKKQKMNIGNRKSPRLLEKSTITKTCKGLGVLQWIVDAPFNGHLNLVELSFVNIKSRKMMQAITSLCPNLRIVHFDGRIPEIAASDRMSAQGLQSMFTREHSNANSCWSKITQVEFTCVPHLYRQVFLSLFGHQLKKLDFSASNSYIDPVKELLPCTQLEALSISHHQCSIVPLPSGAELPSAETFLPQLKKLKILICLREWSPLLECHRSSLESLALGCPHFNMASRGKYGWADLPLLWPNVRRIFFVRSDGFTVDLLCQMVPQFKNLIILFIPSNLCQSNEEWQRFKKFRIGLLKQEPTGPHVLSHVFHTNALHN